MSSFLTNIRLNNLERKIEGIIDDIGITNPMVGNLDANNHAINNASLISFTDTQTDVNQVLTVKNSELNLNDAPYGNLSNPLTQDLDLDNNKLININQLKFNDQDIIFSLDGGISFSSTVSLGNNDINGVNTLSTAHIDLNNGSISWNGTNLFIGNETIITDENINSYIDTEAEFQKITIGITGPQYTLGINPTNDLALYSGSVVENANKVGQIVYNSDTNGISTSIINFQDSADSANHHLKLTDITPYRLQIDDKNIVIQDDLDNYFSKNEDIQLQHDMYLNFHNIADINELGIGVANKVIALDAYSDLTFDNNKVITSANITSYIDGSNIFQQVYKNSYLTDFNPSYTFYNMPITLTPELQGITTPTLGYSIFIKGHLNVMVLGRLPNGSDDIKGNEVFDYEVLIFGSIRSWTFYSVSDEGHNIYQHDGGGEDAISFLTDANNDNTILLKLNFDGTSQLKIMNSYSVIVNSF
jgi:hypothetical protein